MGFKKNCTDWKYYKDCHVNVNVYSYTVDSYKNCM